MSRRDPHRFSQRVFYAFRYGNERRFGWDLNREMAWAVSKAAFDEVPVEEVLRLLAHPANAGGAGRWWQHKIAKYGEGCQHRLEREVRRTYEKFAAQRRQAIRDRSEARRVIGEMRDVAAAQVWPGRSGPADQRVLIAHMTLAIQAGSVRYGASARQVAETANVSVKTAIAATRRLVALGALAQVAPGRVNCESARYRLSEDDKVATTVLPFKVGMVVEGMSLWELRLHPLFQHGSGFDSDVYAALVRVAAVTRANATRTATALRRLGRTRLLRQGGVTVPQVRALLPGTARIVVSARVGRRNVVVGSVVVRFTAARAGAYRIPLNAAGKRLARRGPLALTITSTFTAPKRTTKGIARVALR